MSSETAQGPVHPRIPEGDNRERLVCNDCGFVLYSNPKVMVGSVVHWEERVLLCRREIEPRAGYWTLPAGFMENGETTEQGALREAREETGADIALDHVLAVYNIPRISQVQVIYAGRLLSPDVYAGDETLEVGLFNWGAIPWDDLAFPSVRWALEHWREALQTGNQAARSNPTGETGDYRAPVERNARRGLRIARQLPERDGVRRSADLVDAVDDVGDDAVFLGLFRAHPVVAVGVLGDALDRLAGFVGDDLVEPVTHLEDFPGLDLDLGRLAADAAHGLVQQEARVGRAVPVFLGRGEIDVGAGAGDPAGADQPAPERQQSGSCRGWHRRIPRGRRAN